MSIMHANRPFRAVRRLLLVAFAAAATLTADRKSVV